MRMKQRTYSGTTSPETSSRELANRIVAKKAAEEGIVLLKNEGRLLPLEKGKRLALFGSGAGRTIKGGTGSGDVNERSSVSVVEGLENAGFAVTTKSWIEDYERAYMDARNEWKQTILKEAEGGDAEIFFQTYAKHAFRIPSGRLMTEEEVKEADTDTALYVISRIAGEGADRFAEKGDYYLTDAEEEQIAFVCSHFAHVVLLINTGAQIDLSILEKQPKIEAVLFMVQAGMEGGNAVARVLTGEVNPSGKLTDTWGVAYEDYPAAKTFSHNNGNVRKEYYEEGIYVGYRYFDRFGKSPRYAFGYGLSYTEFALDLKKAEIKVSKEDQTIAVSVPVKNIGEIPGKEVVQVYGSCPQEGIPKEYKRLLGYAKTGLLKSGETEVVSVAFPVKALASFEEGKSAWILEKGMYALRAGNCSDSLSLIGGLEVKEEAVIEKTTPICERKEALQEVEPPKAEAMEYEASWKKELLAKSLPVYPLVGQCEAREDGPQTEMEKMAKDLAEKLTDEELIHLVVGEVNKSQNANALGSAGIMVPGAAGETSSILSQKYGIPGLPMADGPAGLRLSKTYEVNEKDGSIYARGLLDALEGGFFTDGKEHEGARKYYQYCTAFPVGTLLAQTWNRGLLEEVGQAVAEEMEEFGITWWLAPGMNIHRDPMCGRNFEYYSEDPVVSGLSAAAITKGVQSRHGVGTTIKHFACNNQEDNRKGSDSILSERTLREIYLKGFEIAVKEAKPMAIMTSYNLVNGVHSANSYDLCTTVARGEWGFRGIIMTDWTTTDQAGGSIPHLCINAGNDLIMPGTKEDLQELQEALKEGSLSREALKACAARLIAEAFGSNQMEEE